MPSRIKWPTLIVAAAAAVTAGLLLSTAGRAQIPTVTGDARFVQAITIDRNLSGSGGGIVYTVPANRRLIVTDVLASNNGTAPSAISVASRAPGVPDVTQLNPVYIQPSDTFEHTFATGLDFERGSSVIVSINSTDGITFVTLRGYLSSR